MPELETKFLPENAYRPLGAKELYLPIVPAEANLPEITLRSVLWGTAFCVIFSVASAYSALKVGQGMEAAIPISILAIGLARMYRRRSTVLENMIITGMGGASAAVVSGAVFTVPALYALHLDPHPVQTIFICLAGGCLGILFLIPLRRYFVREMHGKLPFPEATAITEVLVTGEKGGSQARLLLQATVIAAIYDFFVTTFHVWKEYLNFQFVPAVKSLAERGRMVFNFDAVSFILGLGYVMGLRVALIFCAGGVLVNFVLVPMIWFIGSHLGEVTVYPATIPISHMGASDIYRNYVRFIGVGAIASAGLVGIIKSLRVVVESFRIALHAFRHGEAPHMERTDRDVPIVTILLGVVLGAIAVAIFFGQLHVSWTVVFVGLLLTLVFSFFFTTVAANAIATTANNPASGMTLLTVIVSAVVLLKFGLSGTTGIFFVMALAGMVCVALCASGQFITDLKTGYWIGSTPGAQEKVKFIGVVAAAITAGLTIILLAKAFQFGEAVPGDLRQVLVAPQASALKAVVSGFMSGQPAPYVLFGIGAMVTVVLEMLGLSSMVFALGIYLPLQLTTPILAGGFLSHLVNKRGEKIGGEQGKSVRERGIILAGGLMAGGALGGVIGAALRVLPNFKEEWVQTPFYENVPVSQTVSALAFVGLCLYVWFSSLKTEKEHA
ncbi:Oligopeptide transporter, OPT [Candidatus Sulfotelmatobacter kueseliae]|uniref:Oligopeptide transporter, OPT n=1 Tax=Candidatus Sulfotelmatobacter kueseliae TaxID=2042962 RepID=A0A2U3KN04_9BACT|nr:Oligopeptide transporter, OPT [Candidatus Sulfotelmatobacter kueseliae]